MKLRHQLIYGLTGVVILTILTMGIATSWGTRHLFNEYVDQHFQYRAEQMTDIFANYYEENNSWDNINQLFVASRHQHMMMGRRGMGKQNLIGILPPGERLRLVDETGQVLLDSFSPLHQPEQISFNEQVSKTTPIIIAEQTVGYLVWDTVEPANFTSLEKDFINSMIKITMMTMVAIGLLAGLIGGGIATRLVAPLEVLIKTAQRYNSHKVLEKVELKETATLELNQLTAAYNQMIAQLNASEKSRKQLIADIAHEIRTPLTILRCNLEAMANGVKTIDQHNLIQLQGEVDRLSSLVEELKELSMLEQKKQKLNYQSVDLIKLINDTIDFFQVEADNKHIQLQLIAPATGEAYIDPSRLTQVMVNLFMNSLRYTPAGGKIQVRVELLAGDYWQVVISDSGSGIPVEDLPFVFERFYKSDKARSRENSGSGLGLAIVKAIVEAHGGTVVAKNDEINGGGQFIINLPKKQESP